LARYPRDPDGDAAKAEARGVDIVFAPDEREVYPGSRRIIEVRALALADQWEGAVRPGHFAGVLTVVAKLFNIARPDVAIFGQKDIQQATLVRAMVRELDFPLELIVAPTVREPDGLAMSSRNSYLSAQDRQRALVLSRALRALAAAFGAGERNAAALARIGQEELATVPAVQVDYLAIVDPERMEPVREASPGTIVAVAARVGQTRLIDNVILEAP
jgi:pantoate--beta-alanine ligase